MPNQIKIDIKGIINITLRLFSVCTLVAVIVASVYFVTEGKIEANSQKQKIESISKIFSMNEYNFEIIDVSTENTSVEEIYVIKDKKDKTIAGYTVFCSPKGFGGEISMMVAFDTERIIKSVKILDLKETPGIGDKINNDKEGKQFREQFTGMSGQMTFGVDGVDKISGSSKSSKAVLTGVNDSVFVIDNIK